MWDFTLFLFGLWTGKFDVLTYDCFVSWPWPLKFDLDFIVGQKSLL